MSTVFLFILLVCAIAGVLSELITIAVPEKIITIPEQKPEELLKRKFYRIIFILSGLYMLVVVLLIFSGINRFQLYALIIFIMSVFGWIFKETLKKNEYVIVGESTICLILLLDVIRSIITNNT